MRVTVKLFGAEADAAGQRAAIVSLFEGATVADLRPALAHLLPALAGRLEGCRFAVNHAFADDDMEVRTGDEVALIGQVSGG